MTDQPWDKFLTERDRAVFTASGYGRAAAPGSQPALLIIDVNRDFVGDRPEPVLESIKRFPNSCGHEGWDAMERLLPLLAAARTAGIPVVYTTNDPAHGALEDATWGRKNDRLAQRRNEHSRQLSQIPELIAPAIGDTVIAKTKPSAFFDTPLRQYLTVWGIDTLYCCGTSTSGCVRATVVDAFSHGYRVGIVTDCTFDRGQASHAISLFDMGQKYADPVTSEELIKRWRRV